MAVGAKCQGNAGGAKKCQGNALVVCKVPGECSGMPGECMGVGTKLQVNAGE